MEELDVVNYNLMLFTIFNDTALKLGSDKFMYCTDGKQFKSDINFLESKRSNPMFKEFFKSVN